MSQHVKMRVEFDNESDGDAVDLGIEDVTLDIGGQGLRLAPESVVEGYIAVYELTNIGEDEFVEALDGCAWAYTGMSEIDEVDAPGL